MVFQWSAPFPTPQAEVALTTPIRHRPRSFTNVYFARCGVKRDLMNQVILANKGITCPKCIALQDRYKAKAKAELDEMMAKPRGGPLRMPSTPWKDAKVKKRKYFLP